MMSFLVLLQLVTLLAMIGLRFHRSAAPVRQWVRSYAERERAMLLRMGMPRAATFSGFGYHPFVMDLATAMVAAGLITQAL